MPTKNEIKQIQSLHLKKNRDLFGVFTAEGEKLIAHLLKQGCLPEAIYTTDSQCHAEAVLIPRADMKRISRLKNPANVFGVFKKPKHENPFFGGGLILILDGIQDPGNMGTIIRLCDWFGINELVVTPDCVDIFNEKVVQATMGSIATVPVIVLTRSEIVSSARQNQYSLVGTDMHGEVLYDTSFPKNVALVIGNEGQGLSNELQSALAKVVMIPAASGSKAESLNAAVATSIVVSEIRRSQRLS